MKNKILILMSLLLVFSITSCSSYDASEYANNEPKLDIREYLNGNLTAHGVIFDWSGKVSRHFTVDMNGKWQGNNGTLTEYFTYSDGQKQKRVWELSFKDEHNFTGTAGDVIGDGNGTQYGNAVHLNYTLRQKRESGSTIDLNIDDWMFLTDKGVLLNRSKLYKFGIPVGEVFIAFTKVDNS